MFILPITLDFQTEAVTQGLIPSSVGQNLFGNFVGSLLSGIMLIALVLVLLQLVQGAFDWINSSGDKAKLDAGRQKITNAIVGVIVLASIVALFGVLQSFLGIEVFNFENSGSHQQTTPTQPNTPVYGQPGFGPGIYGTN